MENFVDHEQIFVAPNKVVFSASYSKSGLVNKLNLFTRMSTTSCSFNLFLWKALDEAMANIKLDKKVIVSFRFTVADESRLLVVLHFAFFFL